MRGASSHDGKLHGNVQTVEAYNADHGHGKPKSRLQRPHESGGHSGGAHDPSGHDEIKRLVGEHGPAHTHTIRRDEDGLGFTSEAEHEDGHVSHEEHETLEHAHEHGMHAMGEGSEEDSQSEPIAPHGRHAAGRRAADEHAGVNFMEEE